MDGLHPELPGDECDIRIRDCFSVKYIQSAALFCRFGWAIESGYASTGTLSAEERLRHEAFVLNALFSTVAFLESSINELWSDAADDAFFFADKKGEALLRAVGEKWSNENYFDRTPLPAKYQKVLEIGNMHLFPDDDPDFSGIKDLIMIRNYLMHYRREWVIIHSGRQAGVPAETHAEKFEQLLKHRFAENPLAAKNLPFFPDRCLGHGCAEWAVTTSLSFTDRFFRELSLPASYEGIRDELVTR
ncbi:hypothetical protein Mboo_2234 [Methanoregula boonei 6A8]|jgi:hypothetical protein|uniref:Uncharacterized protein n=1 Tax=Methanoregula boonei (strain DSM 21154 / JCM 14090 / 6A8) TaxID=456442 RepID=A7IAI7_METB6|nr:hypothetical protein [Methanoregula boonei]ABS56748.1 hypothetical protein Mboo_2234 [Methanoregula boonei 6A8]